MVKATKTMIMQEQTKGNTIHRAKKVKGSFTSMAKAAIFDKKLSAKAKGILAVFLARPDDWKFNQSELFSHFSDGKESLKSGLKELTAQGYLIMRRTRMSGRFQSIYTVYEEPQESHQSVKPAAVKPAAVKPSRKSASYNNTDYSPALTPFGPKNKKDNEEQRMKDRDPSGALGIHSFIPSSNEVTTLDGQKDLTPKSKEKGFIPKNTEGDLTPSEKDDVEVFIRIYNELTTQIIKPGDYQHAIVASKIAREFQSQFAIDDFYEAVREFITTTISIRTERNLKGVYPALFKYLREDIFKIADGLVRNFNSDEEKEYFQLLRNQKTHL